MFKHILVPLDGSSMAEAVLPIAVLFSKTMHASVTLIHVIEQHAPETIHGQKHLTQESEACDYLAKVTEAWFSEDANIERHVHTEKVENVANSIVNHASELEPDLIILCAHGQSGLHDLMAGNIAQQVISHGKTPVLLLRPTEHNPEITGFQHFLIALDGIPEHENGLPLVAELAKTFSADLHLVQVVPTLNTLSGEKAASGRLMPGATTLLLEMAETAAVAHLQEHAAEWQASDLQVTTEVRRGDPAAQVVASAQETDADLIILGTHGKAGMKAFWAGSIASKIIAQVHTPLLLIPVKLGTIR